MNDLSTNQILEIVRFCADECSRQESGEMSVSNMVNAYSYAYDHGWRLPSESKVKVLGYLVEPVKNANGYRNVPVTFRNLNIVSSDNIVRQMDFIMACTLDDISPEEFYQWFESIHPFIDGNGRVGAILYNWYNGTLANPVRPPRYGG